jgi:energy-coupling factor transporter ATP-binding protein EcfA2
MKTSENPFASNHLAPLPFRFPPGVTWETLLARLEGQNYCAAIVGRLGSGKTTLLEQLAPHLEKRGFEPVFFRLAGEVSMREKERLPEKLRQVSRPGFILLDGAEQLSTRHWLPARAAASQAAGFVVTVHRTSRLPTLFDCETNVPLLEGIVHDLSGGKLPQDEAETLLARHHGNVRAVLRELHDRWGG